MLEETHLENAALVLEFEMEKLDYRAEELERAIGAMKAKEVNLPKGMFRKLHESMKKDKLVVTKFSGRLASSRDDF